MSVLMRGHVPHICITAIYITSALHMLICMLYLYYFNHGKHRQIKELPNDHLDYIVCWYLDHIVSWYL